MTSDNAHPTRDELLVMAYVDDELADEQRSTFQNRLADEPELARQVAAYRKLEILTRQMAPPEPRDHEWHKLEREPEQRHGHPLGWMLVLLGTVGLGLWLFAFVLGSTLDPWAKACLLSLGLGLTLLLFLRWRRGARLAPYDPYTEVRR
jgi:anti-sigma factor RsiW